MTIKTGHRCTWPRARKTHAYTVHSVRRAWRARNLPQPFYPRTDTKSNIGSMKREWKPGDKNDAQSREGEKKKHRRGSASLSVPIGLRARVTGALLLGPSSVPTGSLSGGEGLWGFRV